MNDYDASDDPLEALRRDYRVAFLRYLPHADEAALATAYDIGRRVLPADLGLLHVVHVHHEVLGEVLAAERPEQWEHLVQAAGEFMSEVLAAMHMIQRPPRRGRLNARTPTRGRRDA
ncbi:phosphatase RsbU N-terminal domain-containing protein [Cumulibacter manganitolerans]|uniref:phosphatase RsbU N-terminal domain-containing protein n=1 Tax=Cumulibacter manganitolerans TaxID=1884992 RepID=UPI0012974211|nr:phosphatase RsbU N-terminal domain-containing protein [Cumulibacter manganitolerans]